MNGQNCLPEKKQANQIKMCVQYAPWRDEDEYKKKTRRATATTAWSPPMPFFFYLFLSQLTYVLSIPRSLQRRFESLSDNCTAQVARNLPPRRLLNRLHCRQRQEKKSYFYKLPYSRHPATKAFCSCTPLDYLQLEEQQNILATVFNYFVI